MRAVVGAAVLDVTYAGRVLTTSVSGGSQQRPPSGLELT
jgi:hypothetical protein